MSCTAVVYVDLSDEPDLLSSRDRKELAALDSIPAGARVVVDIGSRQWVSDDVARALHRHSDRLLIEIQGTVKANLRAWLAAARAGRVEVS